MKKINICSKIFISVLLVLQVVAFVMVPASALIIKNKTDSKINQALAAIDAQNFSSSYNGTNAAAVKEIISYFIFDSKWAAIGGDVFPYQNYKTDAQYKTYIKDSNGNKIRLPYVTKISDGVKTATIPGAVGCYAYCDYVSKVIYGKEGDNPKTTKVTTAESLKSLLIKHGQAGEHVRINGHHSVTFVSCNEEGLYVLEYAGDISGRKIKFSYYSYSDFVKRYPGSEIWIYNKANPSGNSVPENVKNSGKPLAPTGLTMTKAGSSTARLSWTPVPGAYYKVMYSSSTSSEWKTDLDYKDKTSTSYITTGLGSKTYYFHVQAFNSASESEWTTVTYNKSSGPSGSSGTVTKPNKPTGLTVERLSDTSAKVSWNAVSNATSYEVEYNSPKSGRWVTDSEYRSKTATSYIVTQLGASVTYQFRVYAINSAGKSEDSYVTYTNKIKTEPEPEAGKATIQYNANGGTGAPASHTVEKDSNGVIRFSLSTTIPTRSGYTFLGWRLENNTAYGIDSPGQSIAISIGNVSGNDTLTYYAQWKSSSEKPSTPTNFIIKWKSSGTATVSWSPVTGATSYEVEFWSRSWNDWRADYEYSSYLGTQTTSYTTSGLSNHSSYEFRVRAVNPTGKSDWAYVTYYKDGPTELGIATIKYNTNGGSGGPSSHSVSKDSNGVIRFNLSSTMPTRSGYTFLGWRLENNTAYGIDSPGQSIAISIGNVSGSDTLTYYAQWKSSSEKPSTPTNFTIKWKSSGTATVSWSPVTGATSYDVEFWSRSWNEWRADYEYSSYLGTQTTSYTTNGLSNHSSYEFRVRAKNSNGNSDWTYFTLKR